MSGLDIINTKIKLVGDSSLIVQSRQDIDSGENYMNSLYYLSDTGDFGYPTDAFKAAAVNAAPLIQYSKQTARAAFIVPGDMVRLDASPPFPSKYTAKVGGKMVTLERAEFLHWQVVLPIKFDASMIDEPTLIDLFEKAGFSIGIGEKRPQRGGSHGMFHVED